MNWRLAKSLMRLRAQADAMAPRRSKAADGTIGDQAHAARRSGHNPDGEGIVRALDITHDPRNGLDVHDLADRVLRQQDPRLRYVISKGRIGSGPMGISPGRWRRYQGANPHDKHAHFEVIAGPFGDRDGAWQINPRASRDRDMEDEMSPNESAQLKETAAGVAELKQEVDGLRRDIRELGTALKLKVRDTTKLDGVIES